MKRIYPQMFLTLGALVETANLKLKLPVNKLAIDQSSPGHPRELMPSEFKKQPSKYLPCGKSGVVSLKWEPHLPAFSACWR